MISEKLNFLILLLLLFLVARDLYLMSFNFIVYITLIYLPSWDMKFKMVFFLSQGQTHVLDGEWFQKTVVWYSAALFLLNLVGIFCHSEEKCSFSKARLLFAMSIKR